MQTYTVTGPGLFGLGQESATLDALNHALVPFRSRARFLRLVSTKSQALNYGAGGFHVSVTRGLAGGCGDPSKDFASGGTKAGSCVAPLARDDIRTKWRAAASAYKSAFAAAQSGAALPTVVGMLRTANDLADQAYAAENVEPPRDPVTGDSEPVAVASKNLGVGLAFGLAGLLGVIVYSIRRGQVDYEAGMWV